MAYSYTSEVQRRLRKQQPAIDLPRIGQRVSGALGMFPQYKTPGASEVYARQARERGLIQPLSGPGRAPTGPVRPTIVPPDNTAMAPVTSRLTGQRGERTYAPATLGRDITRLDLGEGQGMIANASRRASNIPGISNVNAPGGTSSTVEAFRGSENPDPTIRALANAELSGYGGELKNALSEAIGRGDYESADLAVRNPEERLQYREGKFRSALLKDVENRIRGGQRIGQTRAALAERALGSPYAGGEERALELETGRLGLAGKAAELQSLQEMQALRQRYLDPNTPPEEKQAIAALLGKTPQEGKYSAISEKVQIGTDALGNPIYGEQFAGTLNERTGAVNRMGGNTTVQQKPSLEQFMQAARAANPGISDEELMAYYRSNYGG